MAAEFENIPDDLIPRVEDLQGDLLLVAQVVESVMPGCGVKVVMRLAAEFRGTYVYFRNLDDIVRTARNRAIVEMYTKGQRVPEIARAVKLSERQVWTVLGSEPGDDRQLKLF
jgi:Mor family transcriptional regulator